MQGVCRAKDICTGHECYPPRENISWSQNVFVNSRGWHRKDDAWGPHCDSCDDDHPCHISKTVASGSVFVNSRPGAKAGDPLDCGSAIATGSPNVRCGFA